MRIILKEELQALYGGCQVTCNTHSETFEIRMDGYTGFPAMVVIPCKLEIDGEYKPIIPGAGVELEQLNLAEEEMKLLGTLSRNGVTVAACKYEEFDDLHIFRYVPAAQRTHLVIQKMWPDYSASTGAPTLHGGMDVEFNHAARGLFDQDGKQFGVDTWVIYGHNELTEPFYKALEALEQKKAEEGTEKMQGFEEHRNDCQAALMEILAPWRREPKIHLDYRADQCIVWGGHEGPRIYYYTPDEVERAKKEVTSWAYREAIRSTSEKIVNGLSAFTLY